MQCYFLSSTDAVFYHDTRFGQGTGQIWLQHIFCRGHEERLIECSHFPLGIHNCGHIQDVGVACIPISKFIRTIGGIFVLSVVARGRRLMHDGYSNRTLIASYLSAMHAYEMLIYVPR